MGAESAAQKAAAAEVGFHHRDAPPPLRSRLRSPPTSADDSWSERGARAQFSNYCLCFCSARMPSSKWRASETIDDN